MLAFQAPPEAGLPHSRVVHVQIIANRPHHNFPGVEPHARLQLQTMGPTHLLSIAAQSGLHGQGRITGPYGVVFMSHRSAEEGHDAVAQDLVHRALKAVHRVHHVLEGGIEEGLGRLWIKVADQLGRTFQVGKQHRHLFALAF
jgi:hypothetical protein